MKPQRHVIVFLRAPRLGRVKTRLAKGIGAVAALAFYREASAATVRRLGRDRRWRLWLAVTPDREATRRHWPGRHGLIAQGRGDLGRRMLAAFAALPPGQAVLVGSDIPGLEPRHVWRAFGALGAAEAVFGPSEDGGYWLIGFARRRRRRRTLAPVRWSSRHALADSVKAIGPARVAFADRLADVDTHADLVRLRTGTITKP